MSLEQSAHSPEDSVAEPADRADGARAGVDLGPLRESLGFLVRLAQVRIYEQFFAAFEGQDIRPGEATVLWVIDLNPGLRQGELAATLRIKPAAMTKLVARLVRSGWVRRIVPPCDRRSIHLQLTAAGAAHLEGLRQTFLDVHAAERVGLSDVEYRKLIALLRKLSRIGG